MSKLRKALRKVLLALLILLSLIVTYGIYVSPVFLEHGGGGCLNDERRYGSHSDYIWGLRWIRWSDTVICGIDPPTQDGGTQDSYEESGRRLSPLPIPPDREWQRSHTDVKTKIWEVRLHYFAISLPGGYHARIGWRWDNVDNFYVFSICIKKVTYSPDLLLWHWLSHRYKG